MSRWPLLRGPLGTSQALRGANPSSAESASPQLLENCPSKPSGVCWEGLKVKAKTHIKRKPGFAWHPAAHLGRELTRRPCIQPRGPDGSTTRTALPAALRQ